VRDMSQKEWSRRKFLKNFTIAGAGTVAGAPALEKIVNGARYLTGKEPVDWGVAEAGEMTGEKHHYYLNNKLVRTTYRQDSEPPAIERLTSDMYKAFEAGSYKRVTDDFDRGTIAKHYMPEDLVAIALVSGYFTRRDDGRSSKSLAKGSAQTTKRTINEEYKKSKLLKGLQKRFERVHELLDAGKIDSKKADEMIEKFNPVSYAMYLQAEAAYDRKDYKTALHYSKMAVEGDVFNVDGWDNYAWALARNGKGSINEKRKTAKLIFQEAEKYNPHNINIKSSLSSFN